MNRKDEELSIFKIQEELLSVQKVKKTKYKTATVGVVSSFPPSDDHAIWREKWFESVEFIYILQEPSAYFMANLVISSW